MALQFVGGDEVVETFVLKGTDGNIIDLTTVTLTGGVWWGRLLRIPLEVDDGIEITNAHPSSDQDPHGNITLTGDEHPPAQTRLIPFGQIASIRLIAVRELDGITMSTFFVPLERIR